jgi:hypothetical protein
MFTSKRRQPTHPLTNKDFARLRETERILIAEHEAAMDRYVEAQQKPSILSEGFVYERAIVAMRRLGAFLMTREIPEDIAKNLG